MTATATDHTQPPAAGRHAALPQPIPATAHTSLMEDHHADH